MNMKGWLDQLIHNRYKKPWLEFCLQKARERAGL